MDELVAILKQHYEPKRLTVARRFYFHRRDQAAHETISEYMAELRKLATPCEFGEYLDEALRDRLVCGLRSETIQNRLLSEAELSLTKAVTMAQSMEAAELETKSLQVEKTTIVNNVRSNSSGTRPGSSSTRKACQHCGKNNHTSENCFYKEAACHHCKRTGHLAKVCRAKQQGRPASQNTPSSTRQNRMQWIGERSPTPEDEYPLFCVAYHTIN